MISPLSIQGNDDATTISVISLVDHPYIQSVLVFILVVALIAIFTVVMGVYDSLMKNYIIFWSSLVIIAGSLIFIVHEDSNKHWSIENERDVDTYIETWSLESTDSYSLKDKISEACLPTDKVIEYPSDDGTILKVSKDGSPADLRIKFLSEREGCLLQLRNSNE